MIRTRVGYTGGTLPDPTYSHLGDHTESFQIDYDPRRTSYEALLGYFWKEIDPSGKPYKRQYMSAVFYENEAQQRLALATGTQAVAGSPEPLRTPILRLGAFYRAEDYHQKYYLRRYTDLMRAFAGYNERQFEDSTVAMWLNACVDGQWKLADVEAELERLGLSEADRQPVRQLVQAALAHRRR